jgi:hypothetical protein
MKKYELTGDSRTVDVAGELREYLVTWRTEVTAHNPHEAAQQAQKIQRDLNEEVSTFHIKSLNDSHTTSIDIWE